MDYLKIRPLTEKEKKVISEFGLTLISEELYEKTKNLHHLIRRRFFIAHRDFGKIISKDFAIVSGRGPSADIHIVHALLFDCVRELQEKFKVNVFIPVSDDEKFWFGKASYEDAKKYAIENIIDILALGFNPKRTKIFIDTYHMNAKFYDFVVRIAKKLTYNMVEATFGLNPSSNVGAIFYPAIQIGHILLPTYLENKPSLVIIGIDQDPFMRLTRYVAEEFKMEKPGCIELRFIRGLDGSEKMSASQPYSAIYLNDSPELIKKKVFKAFTGGQPTLKEQREKGGNPAICCVFEYICLFEKDDKKVEEIYYKCKNGEIFCGECKKILLNLILQFKERIEKNREKVKEDFEKYILQM